MRELLDLDATELNDFAMLIHGDYNSGKTHLAGDMLVTEREYGEILYLNIVGEDGQNTLAHMGLGKKCLSVTNYPEMLEAIKAFSPKKLQALVVDTLRPAFNNILTGIVGEPRLPDAKKDGDRSRFFWGQARFEAEQFFISLRQAAHIVLCTVPSAKTVNEVTGDKSITPDIYGAMSHACVGCFDFAGYLFITPGATVKRSVAFYPRLDALTRQRLPKPITKDIVLPTGPGGWALIKKALQEGMSK